MNRFILLLIAFSFGLDSHAQGTLLGASVQVELSKEDIHITQTFHLELPDTTEQIHIRALRFDHLMISDFTIQSDLLEAEEDDLVHPKLYSYHINATDDQQLDDLTISYTWQRSEEKEEIPLFFPEVPAATSHDTLFSGEIQLPEEFAFRMDFPKVDFDQVIEEGSRKVHFSLPALPSLLRIYYGDKANLSANIGLLADWFIAIVFMIMAIIIWFNRKRLSYG